MNRKQDIKTFAVALFAGLLAGVGTLNVGYGLAAFVIVFLGFGGWELDDNLGY
jgi:hypothetical protein